MSLADEARQVTAGRYPMPVDRDAEQALLGVMLLNPDVVEYACDRLTGGDFWIPRHESLFSLIVAQHRAGRPTDQVAVLGAALDAGLTGIDGGYVFELAQAGYGDPGYLVSRIRDRAMRREVIAAGVRTVQMATTTDRSPEALIELARADLDRIQRAEATDDAPVPMTEFVGTETTHNWLVPGLIEYQERIMLTAPESFGKSTLVRQLVVCVAAGVHPFNYTETAKRRVLVVDCENPPGLNRRMYAPLMVAARRQGWDGQGLWMEARPDGLDLAQPGDAAWLLRQARRVKPELLCIGPVYKLLDGDEDKAYVVRPVIKVIDYLRDKIGCAILLEAHSPHGTDPRNRPVRPVGSTVWRRWPDFGLGLRPASEGLSGPSKDRLCEVVQWKARDVRQWPAGLRAGGHWPWVPVGADEIEMRGKR